MSGHSQFANIMHRKGAQDQKRSKVFQRITREIHVAVKSNGPEPSSNPRLRTVLEKARSFNMPKDIINRAIRKASNLASQSHYENVTYEGYGPGSVAIIINCLTDNKHRTASNIRSYFNKYHGKLGLANSVQYLFSKTGVIEFYSDLSLEQIIDIVIAHDLLNWEQEQNLIHLEVDPSLLTALVKTLAAAGITDLLTSEIYHQPTTYQKLDNPEEQAWLQKLLIALEDDEDVASVEHNFKN